MTGIAKAHDGHVTETESLDDLTGDSERRLRTIFDHTYQFIGLLSPTGLLLEANRSSLEFAGIRFEDVAGRPFPETPWWSHSPPLQAALRDAISRAQGGALVRFEATHVSSAGAVHTVDFSMKPVRDARGVVTHLVCEGRDITDRKRAEVELEASRRMLALVLDTIPVRVFWKDRDSRYLGCNATFARDAGLKSTGEIVGRNDFELSWREQAERYRADDRAVMTSGEARLAYEEPQTDGQGSTMWLRTSKIPLRDRDDRIVGVLGVYEDISEQKRREEERRALETQMQNAQKLESLGVLAGGIAHDFNNLLVAILGNVDLLKERSAEAPGDELLAIEMAARRAADLCRQMLAYSGRGRFVVQRLDLNELTREMLQLLHVSVSKKAQLTLDLAEGLSPIEADATQVRQVLMNLVTNASEAIEEGEGRIRVATFERHFDESELRDPHGGAVLGAGRYVALQVDDTGGGMTAATRARIFEPFFTTKFTGRGLGLAAVLGIVRGHKGIVRVDSVPGAGTTFRVLFPAATTTRPRSSPPPPKRASTLRGRILLVDDEPMVRQVTTELLRRLGFEVVCTEDGKNALELYAPDKFACVILDVTMPRLDGVETLHALRSIDPGAKVILASGFDARDVAARAGTLRPAAFLQKPFSLATLARTLEEAMSEPDPGTSTA